MKVELRERDFGELLGLTFSLAVRHFAPLAVLVGLFTLPQLVIQLVIRTAGAQGPMMMLAATPVLLVVNVLAQGLMQGSSTLIVASSFTGGSVSVGQAIGRAFKQLGGVILVSLAVGFLVGFGTLLCIVPGLIFLAWYYVSVPALMVEELGFQDAMARSKELCEDNRGRVIGFALVIALLIIAIVIGVGMVVQTLQLDPRLGAVVEYLAGILIGLPGAVAPVAYYFDVRVRKDAFDLEALSGFVDQIGAQGAEHAA